MCCDLVLGGGKCCDLDPEGGGGVVTWSRGGEGRCCDLVPGMGGVGVVHRPLLFHSPPGEQNE